jgi:hypothetical protein
MPLLMAHGVCDDARARAARLYACTYWVTKGIRLAKPGWRVREGADSCLIGHDTRSSPDPITAEVCFLLFVGSTTPKNDRPIYVFSIGRSINLSQNRGHLDYHTLWSRGYFVVVVVAISNQSWNDEIV